MTDRLTQLRKLIELEQARFDDDRKPHHRERIAEAQAELDRVWDEHWRATAAPHFQHHAFAAIGKSGSDAVPMTATGLTSMSRVLRIPIRDILDTAREYAQVGGVPS